MKKIITLIIFITLLFIPCGWATPIVGTWNLVDGLAAVLDPDNDGGGIGDESVGRDTDPNSSPDNEYYWRFDGLIRTHNIVDNFIDNNDGTGTRDIEVFRTGGTFKIHGDHLWGQASGTIYEISVESHFTGVNYYEKVGADWVWKESVGTSSVRGIFNNDPFLFELTDNVHLDYYGHNNIVGHNVYSGTLTNVVMTVTSIPETATMLIFGFGLLGIAGIGRRRK